MTRRSAGILLFRDTSGILEVFLVHPGGPYWAAKDDGAWSIPKGEIEGDEDPLAAARREFAEETGFGVGGEAFPLRPQQQRGGKVVYAWAVRGDLDATRVKSNTFSIEWPPKSGRRAEFPEIDRAEWFPIETARRKILAGQAAFLSELEDTLR